MLTDAANDPRVDGDHAHWLARRLGARDFALLRPDDIDALSDVVRSDPFATGSTLFRQGAASTAAYVVRSGELELSARRGDRTVTLGVAREGDVIGDIPLLSDRPYPFSAVARTPGTALCLQRKHLVPLLHEHPAIALRWLTSAVQAADRATTRLLDMTGQDLRGRVLALLAEELDVLGVADGPVVIALDQETVARTVGASRQSVNRILGGLREEGLVESGYGRITVADAAALRRAR